MNFTSTDCRSIFTTFTSSQPSPSYNLSHSLIHSHTCTRTHTHTHTHTPVVLTCRQPVSTLTNSMSLPFCSARLSSLLQLSSLDVRTQPVAASLSLHAVKGGAREAAMSRYLHTHAREVNGAGIGLTTNITRHSLLQMFSAVHNAHT